MAPQMKVRVLLVDDNTHFIKALKHLILAILGDRISAIDEAYNGNQAIELMEHHRHYDIVFLDIDMPEKNGIEVANHLNRHFHLIRIVAVSWHKEIEMFTQMFSAGAHSFIVKDKMNEAAIEKAFNTIKGFNREKIG
jgi:two-component system response regulator DegU